MDMLNTTIPSEELNCSWLLLSKDTVCMEHPEEMLKPWKTNPMFLEIIIVHLITFVFGLCGNLVVVVVLSGNGKTRTVTNSFLVSLAVGDLLMLCVYGPLETYTHFVIEWDEDGIVCKTAKFAEFLSATSSVLNLLAVTMERFLVIVFPMKSRSFCTNSNTVKAIMGVWLVSIVLASPILYTTGTYAISFTNRVTTITLNYCNHSIESPTFAIYQFFVIFFVPGVIMIICYAYVIRELWASTKKMDSLTEGPSTKKLLHNSSKRSVRTGRSINQLDARSHYVVSNKEEVNNARKQVIKMLVLIVFLFYASWGPRLTMDILQKLHMIPFTQNIYLLRIILNLITFFHGCINPFVYSFMSKNFRNSLSKHWGKCVCLTRCVNRRQSVLPEMSRRQRPGNGRRQIFRGRETKCSFGSSETKSTEVETVLLYGSRALGNSYSVASSCRVQDMC